MFLDILKFREDNKKGFRKKTVLTGWKKKKKLHELRGVQFLKRFSAKFVSLNVPIRNNFTNIIFIACKLSKICK